MPLDFAIETSDLSKSFDSFTAVDRVTLSVRPGEIFGLVGPDGAGKTTTIRLLVGVLSITSGRARVAGFDLTQEPDEVKKRIGYMSQRFALYGELTVDENIRFFAEIYRVPKAEREALTKRLLDFSKLAPFRTRQARHLSGGMKQKLGLCCALVHTPEVLFLDEPTTGVDPVSRRELWDILYDLLEQKVTIFVSTPYMDEAERCSRVAFLSGGRVLTCDTPSALKKNFPEKVWEVTCSDSQRASELLDGVDFVSGVTVFGERVHVVTPTEENVVQRISALLAAQGITVQNIRQVSPSLEDVFISLARQKSQVEYGGSS